MILTNLISLYIDYMNERKLSDNTVSTYKSVLNRFKSHYADKAIDDIKYSEIKLFLADFKDVSNKTINQAIIVLTELFKYAVKFEYINKSPMDKITKLKAENYVREYFDDDEITDFINNDKVSFRLKLLYETGCRASELIGIKIFNINIPGQYIKIRGKGSKTRLVPLSPECTKKLTDYLVERKSISNSEIRKGDEDILFLSEKKRNGKYHALTRMMINNELKKYVDELNTEKHITPHSLRHSRATHLLNKSNNDIYAVSKFLGHSSVKTTEIYLHNDLNMLKKLVD